MEGLGKKRYKKKLRLAVSFYILFLGLWLSCINQ